MAEVGRPLFDGKSEESVIQKLEEVFAIGGTDAEACFYAGISKTAFYEYQKIHPEFLERKEALKERPILLARQSVIAGLKEDYKHALEYLKCKRKDEFSTKQEVDQTNRNIDVADDKIHKKIQSMTKGE